MLDLALMAAVLDAVPPHAPLILLGDKDQLASVEAGAVLGDLCQRADAGHYRADTAAWLQAVTGELLEPELCDAHGSALDQAVVKLRVSHRFSAASGIGQLAEAVNAGDGARVRRVFERGHADLSHQRSLDDASLRRLVIDGAPEGFAGQGRARTDRGEAVPMPAGYRHYLTLMRERKPVIDAPQADFDAWAREVLAAYGQFQLLCALRSGPQGVEGLNLRIAGLLRAEGLLDAEHGGWYPGRPVLVTRNDYGLGLMNGDVGVTLAMPTLVPGEQRPRWTLRVAFAAGDGEGGIRWVLPSRLRAVETVFAMTVHKSQGSEFAHAALLLPETMSPVLTRELLYTGVGGPCPSNVGLSWRRQDAGAGDRSAGTAGEWVDGGIVIAGQDPFIECAPRSASSGHSAFKQDGDELATGRQAPACQTVGRRDAAPTRPRKAAASEAVEQRRARLPPPPAMESEARARSPVRGEP